MTQDMQSLPEQNTEPAAAPAKKRVAAQPQQKPDWLAGLYPPLEGHLQQVEARLSQLIEEQNGLLAEAGRYVTFSRGKRLRPAIVLLAAAAGKEVNDQAIDAAAVVELIHTASLVHDDVVDEAPYRRGKASARQVWGNKISVLLGDYLICRAFARLIELKLAAMLAEVADVAQQMCRGQVAELTEARPALSESRYREIVAGKTAALFGLCGSMGGACAKSAPAVCAALKAYAYNFGMAFQIADDIQDVIGSQEASGKPVNHDMRQHKMTLPLIFALRETGGDERDLLAKTLSEETPTDAHLSETRHIVKECGGVDYAWSVCRRYLQEAQGALLSLQNGEPALKAPQPGTAAGRARAYQALLKSCNEAFPLPVLSPAAPRAG